MPRKARFNLIGVPQHVIQRGNNREPCYTPNDYIQYREWLDESARKYGSLIHAYVMMTNHVHLLVTPQEQFSVSRMMQSLGRKYVRYINMTYRRTGTLWEGRYKSSLIDSESYLLTCMRYIELNPVRARMVATPAEYRWSSFSANAHPAADSCITAHPVYLALGDSDEERQRRYRALFATNMDVAHLDEIRVAVNQEWVLGNDRFKAKIKAMTDRRVEPGKPGRPRVYEVREQGAYYF